MSNYRISYPDEKDTKGLYFLHPKMFNKKLKLVELWRKYFIGDLNNYESSFPVLVPRSVLEKSGHISAFKDELFKTQELELYLRPETAQGIFPVIKTLLLELKATGPEGSWGIGQVGSAFRLEKSTRDGAFRKREFEQLELEIIHKPETVDRLLTLYKETLQKFLLAIGVSYDLVQQTDTNKPHYSKLTLDAIHKTKEGKEWEIGSISLRTNHDLKPYLSDNLANCYHVLEVSLGLDRLLDLATKI